MSFDDGTVHLSLKSYNDMRDELDQRRKATLTHQEFLKRFRFSFLTIIEKSKSIGLDITDLYNYYKDLDFKEIVDIEVSQEEKDQEIKWIVKLKMKEDEQRSSFTND